MEKLIITLLAAIITAGTMYFFGLWGLVAGCLVGAAYQIGYRVGSGEWAKNYHRD